MFDCLLFGMREMGTTQYQSNFAEKRNTVHISIKLVCLNEKLWAITLKQLTALTLLKSVQLQSWVCQSYYLLLKHIVSHLPYHVDFLSFVCSDFETSVKICPNIPRIHFFKNQQQRIDVAGNISFYAEIFFLRSSFLPKKQSPDRHLKT